MHSEKNKHHAVILVRWFDTPLMKYLLLGTKPIGLVPELNVLLSVEVQKEVKTALTNMVAFKSDFRFDP